MRPSRQGGSKMLGIGMIPKSFYIGLVLFNLGPVACFELTGIGDQPENILCSDGVMNQEETGVDCGGPCAECDPDCTDGLQNQGEVGVDCGGPCPACQSDTKWVGNITQDTAVPADFASYWAQITPENEGKWGSVEQTRDNMNWSRLDTIYNFAKSNGIAF